MLKQMYKKGDHIYPIIGSDGQQSLKSVEIKVNPEVKLYSIDGKPRLRLLVDIIPISRKEKDYQFVDIYGSGKWADVKN